MKKQTKLTIPLKLRLVIIALDIVAFVAAFYATVTLPMLSVGIQDVLRFRYDAAVLDERVYYYGILCALLLVSFANTGHYTRRIPWWGQVHFILKASLIALMVDGFTYFSMQYPFSRYLIIVNWVFVIAFLLMARQIAFYLIAFSKDWRLPVALLGDKQMIMDSMFAFYADGFTGYEVQAALLRDIEPDSFDLSFVPKSHPPISLEKVNGNFAEYIHKNPHYFYVFSLDGFRGGSRDTLMDALEEANVEYAIIPPIKRLHLHGMEPHYFFGNDVMLLHKHNKIETPLWRAVKRLMDIAVSGLALIPLALVLLVVVVMRKVERSSTPLFYGGERLGQNGKLFNCWKFCTMRTDGDALLADLLEKDANARAEWDKFQKLRNDPRIDSRISQILRKTSLDELPQIWNVFSGDMSLVGPRPILENQIADYGRSISSYTSVRPGLTGLWQVSGRNETSFQQRVNWDNWYIRNWSLWHDIIILFKTVRVLISGSGAY
jgi:undecaprenyl-phosphate galactose phosphotransferase